MLDTHGTYTRPRIVHDDDGTEAFITAGEALDRALDSLGLELPRAPEPARPHRLWKALGYAVPLGLVLFGLVWAVHLELVALSALDPTRIPQ